jgi:hypothetical protein
MRRGPDHGRGRRGTSTDSALREVFLLADVRHRRQQPPCLGRVHRRRDNGSDELQTSICYNTEMLYIWPAPVKRSVEKMGNVPAL